jgi:hypothetical protein
MFFLNVTSNPWLEELKDWLSGDRNIALLKEIQHHLSLSILLLMFVWRFATNEAILWSSWTSFGKSIKKSDVLLIKEEWKMLSLSIC